MGQKVNPIGFRTGISRPWASRWYARHDYAKFLQEDLRIRDYIEKKFDSAGVSKVEIERAAANMRVNILLSKMLSIILKFIDY